MGLSRKLISTNKIRLRPRPAAASAERRWRAGTQATWREKGSCAENIKAIQIPPRCTVTLQIPRGSQTQEILRGRDDHPPQRPVLLRLGRQALWEQIPPGSSLRSLKSGGYPQHLFSTCWLPSCGLRTVEGRPGVTKYRLRGPLAGSDG